MATNPMPAPLEILLVEDREADAYLTQQLLEDARHQARVHVVPSGQQAMAFLRQEGEHHGAPTPDLVLLDLDLPDLHGREVLRRIRALDDMQVPVIIVSGASEGRVGEYLHGGAVDYVMKGSALRLCEAVDGAIDASSRLRRLSPAQRRVLRLIAEGQTHQQIADAFGISVKTVESHRSEITKRLGIRGVAGLVRFAVRVGLVTLESAAPAGTA